MALDESTLVAMHNELTSDQLTTQLTIQQKAFAILHEQRAAFGPLYVPPHLMHELHARHQEIVALKLLLHARQHSAANSDITATDILLLRPWLFIVSGAGIGGLLTASSIWSLTKTLSLTNRWAAVIGSTIGAVIVGAFLGWGIIQVIEWGIFWKTNTWKWRWMLMIITGVVSYLLNWGVTIVTQWMQ